MEFFGSQGFLSFFYLFFSLPSFLSFFLSLADQFHSIIELRMTTSLTSFLSTRLSVTRDISFLNLNSVSLPIILLPCYIYIHSKSQLSYFSHLSPLDSWFNRKIWKIIWIIVFFFFFYINCDNWCGYFMIADFMISDIDTGKMNAVSRQLQ